MNETKHFLPREDIAIIGMSCLFPGAPDLQTYWENIIHKVDATTDPPSDWGPEYLYDPSSNDNGRIYCKRGGFLGDLAQFNPMEFGVMPRSVDGGEPDHYLALRLAKEALQDAGYVEKEKRPDPKRIEIILGRGTYINRGWTTLAQHGWMVDQTLGILKRLHPEHGEEDLEAIRRELKAHLPPFNAETASGVVPNILTGRIANRLDFMGTNHIVDAACASSLIALELGVRDLLIRKCDLSLVGGIQASTPPPLFMIFCQLGALSRQGRLCAFGKNADGTLLGEGGGIIVLKRLMEARRDGNRIYAVIKGVGSASDGRGVSVLTPRVEGEVLALQRAYEAAEISPTSIGLIEAHGTGTPVGDLTEIEALRRVFGGRLGSQPSVALGTVKSMISHLIPAAGIAGLIKTALALYHKVLPPTLHCEEPNPDFELEKTPFYLNTETRPWIHGIQEHPRRAGVNAFGFGGINAHAILEESPGAADDNSPSLMYRWDSEVVLLEADSRAGLIEQGQQLRDFVSAAPQTSLKDVAYTLNTRLGQKPFRLAIVASSPEDLEKKLERGLRRLEEPSKESIKDRKGIYFFSKPLAWEGKLAFLFPGEGSQYLNMLDDLCLHFPEVRARFEQIDRVLAHRGRQGDLPSQFIFQPHTAGGEPEGDEEGLWQIEGAVAAVTAANQAILALFRRLDIQPEVMLGHSTGEYTAFQVSGMMDLEGEGAYEKCLVELEQSHQKAASTQGVPSAALLAIGADAAAVGKIIEESGAPLMIGMDNCPHQTVVVGPKIAVEEFIDRLSDKGLMYEVLPFDRPYHSPLFQAYAEHLRSFLGRWLTSPSRLPVYSCTTTKPYPSDLDKIQDIALRHWMRPVRFRETVESMYADEGVRIFLEVGPRGNLTAFVDDVLASQPHLAVASNLLSRSGITQLNHALALLAAHGLPMRLDYLYQRRSPRRLSLESGPLPVREKTTFNKKVELGLPLLTLDPGSPLLESMRKGVSRTSSFPDPAPLSPSLPSASGPSAQRGEQKVAFQPPPQAVLPPVGEGTGSLETATPPLGLAPQAGDDRSQVVRQYFRTMQQFLEMQHEVARSYLTGGVLRNGSKVAAAAPPTQRPVVTPPVIPPEPSGPVVKSPQPTAPAASIGETARADRQRPVPLGEGRGGTPLATIRDQLLRLVSEKTGYPTDMLDLDLDLEADLGIDSIKRVEILAGLQSESDIDLSPAMEALAERRTLREMVDFLSQHRAGRADQPTPSSGKEDPKPSLPLPKFPLLGDVLAWTPGEEWVSRFEVSLSTCPFLRDHTLGRDVSVTQPDWTGLPVMPLTVSMEMLAEAAAALMPGLKVVGMKEIQARRWIALDRKSVTLEVSARRLPTEGEVGVQIRQVKTENSADVPAAPCVEGRVVFASDYPQCPMADSLQPRRAEPSIWPPDRLYEEAMFHGARFRGVKSMQTVGENGAQATLGTLPLKGFLGSGAEGSLLTDPVLLDQPGQVVGFWAAQHLKERFLIFPFRLEALHFFGPLLPPGQELTCQARIGLQGEQQVHSDLDIVRADGRVWVRFIGWEDRRFDLSRRFFDFWLSPRNTVLSTPWPEAVASLPGHGFLGYRLRANALPKDVFSSHGGIWRRILVNLVLSPRERELWSGLPEAQRRLEWLLSRLVAKDAVRQHVRQHHGLALCPADVEILPDGKTSALTLAGKWTRQVPTVPLLSVSQAEGLSVAVVGDGGESGGLGVEVEPVSRMNEDVEGLTFTPQEQRLLTSMGELKDSWPLRFWCAKEAVVKALGEGLEGASRSMVVKDLDIQSGRVEVAVGTEADGRLSNENVVRLAAFTTREEEWVIATSLVKTEGTRANDE
ncbi:MAG: beta-ketoacyl synthase N-terminal-like domain-containing protein [Acidobacteriota bacterium]